MAVMDTQTAIDFELYDRVRPIRWDGQALHLLDQRVLPFREEQVVCTDSDAVAHAITELVVRGAPAIGISAAYGVVLAANAVEAANGDSALKALEPAMQRLHDARPTAVNLAWALNRMGDTLHGAGADWREQLVAMADRIAKDDLLANRRMGVLGAQMMQPGTRVLTHCNTGSLATAGFGTALGVIRAGCAMGRIDKVYAGETRPWLQGARLTVWELAQDGLNPTLIADSAAAHLMKTGGVDWVVAGADRICANGDTANKIGTYSLAIAAKHHGIGFMVVAPASTVDMNTPNGDAIEIEERVPTELLSVGSVRTAAEGVAAWNPVFDVTPAELITAIVTEKGVVHAPSVATMRELFPQDV